MRHTVVLMFALSSLAFTQNRTSHLRPMPASAVQVLYVADEANLYTFDITPKTFQPDLAGTIPLPKPQVNGITASADGKFLYLMASDPYPQTDNRVYVYDTDRYGVPGTPLQSLPATSAFSMAVDPAGKFFFVVNNGAVNQKTETQVESIYRFQVDQANGKLSQPVNEVTYQVPVQATNYCSLSIAGMNANGTEIYDYVFCGTHDGANGTYDERSVNPSTGALGAAQQILSWSTDTDGSPDSVQLVKNLIFDFKYPVDYQPYDDLRILPLLPGNHNPVIDCTATMLPACASDAGVAHPSGKYVFYTNAQARTTEVDAVELGSKQIVATGTTFSTFQPNRLKFSPDGAIAYSWGTTVSVFGFDISTAAITTGGSIWQLETVSILPAERY